jgi:hypothetical protein
MDLFDQTLMELSPRISLIYPSSKLNLLPISTYSTIQVDNNLQITLLMDLPTLALSADETPRP